MIALALALACSNPAPADADAPVALRVYLDGKPKAGGGRLVVQAEYDADGQLGLPDPAGAQAGPQGAALTFTPDGPPVQEKIGQKVVVTQRYTFSGSNGSYEIPALEATWKGGDGKDASAKSSPVFVDLGVEPPNVGKLVDIVEPAPITRWPWILIGVVGALFAGGLALAFRPRRATVKVATIVPPHLAALAAWEKVRDDPSMTIDDKAKEVARIFREYTEAVLGFEATSRTTHELLEHLASLRHLPEGNVPRARRVLRAADRVKFAEERPGGKMTAADWLAELDADLRAFVDATAIRSGAGGAR